MKYALVFLLLLGSAAIADYERIQVNRLRVENARLRTENTELKGSGIDWNHARLDIKGVVITGDGTASVLSIRCMSFDEAQQFLTGMGWTRPKWEAQP